MRRSRRTKVAGGVGALVSALCAISGCYGLAGRDAGIVGDGSDLPICAESGSRCVEVVGTPLSDDASAEYRVMSLFRGLDDRPRALVVEDRLDLNSSRLAVAQLDEGVGFEGALVDSVDGVERISFASVVDEWVAWRVFLPGPGEGDTEVRVSRLERIGLEPPRSLLRSQLEGPRSAYAGPVLTKLGGRAAAVVASPEAVEMWWLDGGSVLLAPLSSPVVHTLQVETLHDSRLLATWHSRDDGGFDAVEGIVFNARGAEGDQLELMAEVVGESDVLYHEDHLWVAGFRRRLDRFSDSGLYLRRLSGSDLATAESEGWVSGWGGLRPLMTRLLVWQGQVTAVWLAEDSRLGPGVAVSVAQVPEESCRAVVGAGTILDDEPALGGGDPGENWADAMALSDELWLVSSGRSRHTLTTTPLDTCP